MRKLVICSCFAALAAFGTPVSVSAQAGLPGREGLLLAAQQTAAAAPQVRRLTVEEAVRLAAENNLGIQIARYDPRLEDLNVAQVRASYTPTLTSTFQTASLTQPNQNFLQGAVISSDDRFVNQTGLVASLPWGGSYDVGLDSFRFESNNFSSTFNPQVRSTFAAR